MTLSISGFSVTVVPLTGTIPRVDAAQNNISRSAYGTPYIGGLFYEKPYSWSGRFYMLLEDATKLEVIFEESDYRRRTQSGDWRITLEDTTHPIKERSPKTRDRVDGTPQEFIENSYGSIEYINYFAKFYVWMPERPRFELIQNGLYYLVDFSLEEAGKFEG